MRTEKLTFTLWSKKVLAVLTRNTEGGLFPLAYSSQIRALGFLCFSKIRNPLVRAACQPTVFTHGGGEPIKYSLFTRDHSLTSLDGSWKGIWVDVLTRSDSVLNCCKPPFPLKRSEGDAGGFCCIKRLWSTRECLCSRAFQASELKVYEKHK